MTLYDPPANPRLSREEFDYTARTRPTGFGEYMSSKLRQGWDISFLGAFARDPFGASERFGPLPDQPLETAREMGYDVDTPRLTEEQWQTAGLARDGLTYEGGTLDHERSRTEEFDRKRYHESVVARYQGSTLAYAAGFGAQVLGGAASPENFIPFVGPGIRAAMVARLGMIGGHAAVGAIDNVIGTALADAYVMPQMAREGETVTAGDFAMDLTLGAVAGTVLGSAGGWLERRRAAANAIRTPGVEPMADALDHASEALDTGTPVDAGAYIRSTDSVQRLQRMAVGDGPDLAGERAEVQARVAASETIGQAEFVAGHETGGVLDMGKAASALTERVGKALDAGAKVTLFAEGKPVEITSITNGMMTDAKGQRWGTMILATSTGPENSLRIERGVGPAVAQAAPPGPPRVEITGGTGPLAAQIKADHDQARAHSDRLGITAEIERLTYEGKTAEQIGRALAPRMAEVDALAIANGARPQGLGSERASFVRKVRNSMGAPSIAEKAEFAAWRTAYEQRHAAPAVPSRQPDLTTTATPLPPEPSVVAAEKSHKIVPPDFTAEQSARMKESGLDAETMGRDQAAIQQAKKQGALTAAQETELETASALAKQHDEEAQAYQSLALCAQRYD